MLLEEKLLISPLKKLLLPRLALIAFCINSYKLLGLEADESINKLRKN
jgi:hypothetical protein